MPLKGIKVVELAGLAPVPFCGMILADFGATVLRVDKTSNMDTYQDTLSNGKMSIALNLKDPEGIKIFRDICKQSDVLIEPFRQGVMEKLGLGPDVLMRDNPRLIYARLTGYGQSGSLCRKAGHEINFISMSGLLQLFSRDGSKPVYPVGTVADYAGGSMPCALGIVLALFERHTSGKGQVIDSSIADGTAYLGTMHYRSQEKIEGNFHFYNTYETKDRRFMAVGALEPQFYANFIKVLGFSEEEAPQSGDIEKFKKIFQERFSEKTQAEWCQLFDDIDACVTPVLTLENAAEHPHNAERETFLKDGDFYIPKPAPTLSRTPAAPTSAKRRPKKGEHTKLVLNSLKYNKNTISKLVKDKIVMCSNDAKL